MKSSVPLIRACEITIPTLNNVLVQGKLKEVLKSLETGSSLGQSLHKIEILPAMVSNLVIVGEESGSRNCTGRGAQGDESPARTSI